VIPTTAATTAMPMTSAPKTSVPAGGALSGFGGGCGNQL
jgi:hypothetical protein